MDTNQQWVFYLKLAKDLPSEYLHLDAQFKKNHKSLIPISLKTLLECTKKKQSIHVLITVRSQSELNYFNKRVKKMMKYLMRTERVHLYIAASFSCVNDPVIMRKNYYNFVRLPVQIDTFCRSVSQMIDIKEFQTHLWPGGIKPRMTLVG